jgi:hypothetical protein
MMRERDTLINLFTATLHTQDMVRYARPNRPTSFFDEEPLLDLHCPIKAELRGQSCLLGPDGLAKSCSPK